MRTKSGHHFFQTAAGPITRRPGRGNTPARCMPRTLRTGAGRMPLRIREYRWCISLGSSTCNSNPHNDHYIFPRTQKTRICSGVRWESASFWFFSWSLLLHKPLLRPGAGITTGEQATGTYRSRKMNPIVREELPQTRSPSQSPIILVPR
jgi:hypothetical protein